MYSDVTCTEQDCEEDDLFACADCRLPFCADHLPYCGYCDNHICDACGSDQGHWEGVCVGLEEPDA